jgi:hypothetical protein
MARARHNHPVRWLLLAAVVGTAVAWLLAAFVPAFQGWRHLANLGIQLTLYLLAIMILLQGFRLFKRRAR